MSNTTSTTTPIVQDFPEWVVKAAREWSADRRWESQAEPRIGNALWDLVNSRAGRFTDEDLRKVQASKLQDAPAGFSLLEYLSGRKWIIPSRRSGWTIGARFGECKY